MKSKMVSKGMMERYHKTVMRFLDFVDEFKYTVPTWEDLDSVVSEWLEHMFHEGEHKTLANDGLAGLQFYVPQAIGRLKHSWKLARVWQRLEPPQRVLPISPSVILGFAGACAHLNLWEEAAALLAGFDTMLRSGELYRLRVKDSTFYSGRAVLALGFTKTGKRNNAAEMVVVESQLAVKALRRACRGRRPNSALLSRGERFFRALFNCLLEFFDIEGLVTVYSLRRGGASWDFLQHQSLERTLLRGRWASTSSARIYLQDVTAMVTHLRLSAAQLDAVQSAASVLVKHLDG